MPDNTQTYNPFVDSSIEPDTDQREEDQHEDDLGSSISNQLTGQSYSDDENQSESSQTSE